MCQLQWKVFEYWSPYILSILLFRYLLPRDWGKFPPLRGCLPCGWVGYPIGVLEAVFASGERGERGEQGSSRAATNSKQAQRSKQQDKDPLCSRREVFSWLQKYSAILICSPYYIRLSISQLLTWLLLRKLNFDVWICCFTFWADILVWNRQNEHGDSNLVGNEEVAATASLGIVIRSIHERLCSYEPTCLPEIILRLLWAIQLQDYAKNIRYFIQASWSQFSTTSGSNIRNTERIPDLSTFPPLDPEF